MFSVSPLILFILLIAFIVTVLIVAPRPARRCPCTVDGPRRATMIAHPEDPKKNPGQNGRGTEQQGSITSGISGTAGPRPRLHHNHTTLSRSILTRQSATHRSTVVCLITRLSVRKWSCSRQRTNDRVVVQPSHSSLAAGVTDRPAGPSHRVTTQDHGPQPPAPAGPPASPPRAQPIQSPNRGTRPPDAPDRRAWAVRSVHRS